MRYICANNEYRPQVGAAKHRHSLREFRLSLVYLFSVFISIFFTGFRSAFAQIFPRSESMTESNTSTVLRKFAASYCSVPILLLILQLVVSRTSRTSTSWFTYDEIIFNRETSQLLEERRFKNQTRYLIIIFINYDFQNTVRYATEVHFLNDSQREAGTLRHVITTLPKRTDYRNSYNNRVFCLIPRRLICTVHFE
jgi:hypothetical protein